MSGGKFEYKVIAIEGNAPGQIETFINGLGNRGFYIVGTTENLVFLCKSTMPLLDDDIDYDNLDGLDIGLKDGSEKKPE